MYLGLLVCVFLLAIVFQVRLVTAGVCNGGITDLESTTEVQLVHSPNYPDGYFNTELCRWNIKVQNEDVEVVRFKIQNSYIRYAAGCGEDYVEVKDGKSSRTIRKWCGEQNDVLPATSSSGSIGITFRTDGKFTDKGFEIAYWSVPKGLIEYQRVELGPINFILFAIFLGILAAIALGMVVIVLKRKNIAKKEDLLEEERKSKMFAVRIEANGNMPNGNEKTHSAGQMNKRTSANNGEAKGGNNTQVICLEPALDEDEKKMSSMTPV